MTPEEEKPSSRRAMTLKAVISKRAKADGNFESKGPVASYPALPRREEGSTWLGHGRQEK